MTQEKSIEAPPQWHPCTGGWFASCCVSRPVVKTEKVQIVEGSLRGVFPALLIYFADGTGVAVATNYQFGTPGKDDGGHVAAYYSFRS